MFMYEFNDDEFLKSKSKKSLKYMMIENDSYEEEKNESCCRIYHYIFYYIYHTFCKMDDWLSN